MAESDFQLTPVAYARDALRDYFRCRPDVYVAANLFIYYEEGNSEAAVAPDVFVEQARERAERGWQRERQARQKAEARVARIEGRLARSNEQEA